METEGVVGVFALAMMELWAAIPLGFHLKLHPALVAAASAGGAFAGAVLAIFVGNGIHRLMFWRRGRGAEGGRLSQWMAARGPWAIGLLGPLLIGPVFAAGLAGAAGLPKGLSLILLAAGIVLWTVVAVALGTFGVTMLGSR